MSTNSKTNLSKNGKRMGRPPKAKANVAAKVITVKPTPKNVTFTSSTAARFNNARMDLNESGRIPFDVTNTQFMGMLLDMYENSSSSL